MLIMIVFISISCVSANDNTNETVNHESDITIDNASATGTFDDLNKDIQNLKPGDVYNVTQDYVFEPELAKNGPQIVLAHEGIEIATDNVTINGNGHTIDGNYNTALFKVTGNNVKIMNLTFINSQYNGFTIPIQNYIVPQTVGPLVFSDIICQYHDDISPVCWSGDNGLIDNCIFTHNTAIIGGAITWTGNNGIINNTQFINNTAQRIGGAIYMAGANNTISNCNFTDSISQLSREAIYLDPQRKNITIKNLKYNELILIDGQITNITAENLRYSVFANISPIENDKQVDIIPLLYKSIVFGGVNLMDDNKTSYFYTYNSTTGDLILTTYLNCGEIMEEYAGIEYIRQFSFTNISDFSKVFTDATHATYKTATTQIGTVYINNADDYAKLLAKKNLPKYFARINDETRELSVIFTKKLSISSNSCFNLDSYGCDIITLYGNDSSIMAKNDDREEDKWVTNSKTIFIAYNIQVGGFNTAIENKGGAIILNNVKLHDNRMDYIMDPDWGAAILNTGYCQCNNCTFINNYCSEGGAIFNYGNLELNNCTFKGNTGYNEGNDVLNVGNGIVKLDGNKITGSKGPITYTESVTSISDILVPVGIVVISVVILGLTIGGAVVAAIIEAPILIIACAVGSGALLVSSCAIMGSYLGPRDQILSPSTQNFNEPNITAPIKIDEIIFN